MGKVQGKTLMGFWVDAEVLAVTKRMAKARRWTVSEFLRAAVDEKIERDLEVAQAQQRAVGKP